MNNQEKIITEIITERTLQDKKWGEQNHSPARWCLILGEEVGEANRAALDWYFENKSIDRFREELIQCAAVALSIIECLDRNKFQMEVFNA